MHQFARFHCGNPQSPHRQSGNASWRVAIERKARELANEASSRRPNRQPTSSPHHPCGHVFRPLRCEPLGTTSDRKHRHRVRSVRLTAAVRAPPRLPPHPPPLRLSPPFALLTPPRAAADPTRCCRRPRSNLLWDLELLLASTPTLTFSATFFRKQQSYV